MIDKEALEEEPIGALIRDVANERAFRGIRHSSDLQLIADEADRREREWRKLYASMKQQNDALARVVQRGLRSINDKLGVLEGQMTKGRVEVHLDPPKNPSAVERMRELGERAWYR